MNRTRPNVLRSAAAAATVLLGTVGWAAPSTAVAVAPATILLFPSSGLPNGVVRVSGTGFGTSATVTVTDETSGAAVCSATTDRAGRFTCFGRMRALPGAVDSLVAASGAAPATAANAAYHAFTAGLIGSLAGGGVGDGSSAVGAAVDPEAVAVDAAGNVYIADPAYNRVRRIDRSGTITTVAGTGGRGFSGDGGPAVNAMLNAPLGVELDGGGRLFISDTWNQRIRMVDRTGVITTIAGTGERGFGGDGGPASAATLADPVGIRTDGSGNLYVADLGNERIRRIDRAGRIATVAGGSGGGIGDGLPAVDAFLSHPGGTAVDGAGNVYIADSGNNRIRRVSAAGTITTIAGTGEQRFSGDGGPATHATLAYPWGVAVDRRGNLYIADSGNNRIRKVDGHGVITTVAGTGEPGTAGDGGPALDAEVESPGRIAIATDGSLYIADNYNRLVRRVDAAGVITTVAGGGTGAAPVGDHGQATDAVLATPSAAAYDAAGNLFIADTDHHRVRKVDTSGVINTVAGTGTAGFSGDGGPASAAELAAPAAIVFDKRGNLLIGDAGNHRMRMVSPSGVITTIAGTGDDTTSGDGGPATDAALGSPVAFAVSRSGELFVADAGQHRIRKIDRGGVITTVAGGQGGFGGDGGPAVLAALQSPQGIAVDGRGNVYIADTENQRIRKVDAAGIITTVAGTGESGFSGDGGPASGAQLSWPTGIAADGHGALYVADGWNQRIRKISQSGVIMTVAGTGNGGFGGDGGPALSATLESPHAVALDAHGGFVIVDTGNARVRQVDAHGVITTIAGRGHVVDIGDGGDARKALIWPADLAVDAAGNLFIADDGWENSRIRKVDVHGIITTIAGTGASGFSGDGGPAVNASLAQPEGVAVDGQGNVFIADAGYSSNRVRKIDAHGIITTVAGTGEPWDAGDGGPAEEAALDAPVAVTVGASADLFISTDSSIRRVDQKGTINLVAGAGTTGHLGDGSPATSATLAQPFDVALDRSGNVFIADAEQHRVRRIDRSTGVITTVAGTGESGSSGDGGPAASATLRAPIAVAVDRHGNVYVADIDDARVRRIDGHGTITTVAGTGEWGFSGDGGPAVKAALSSPAAVAVDDRGALLIGDAGNHRLRRVDVSGTITTVAGGASGDDGGPAPDAIFGEVAGVAVDVAGNVYVADPQASVVRRIDAQGRISTFAGGGSDTSDGIPATSAQLQGVGGLAVDRVGDVLVADGNRVRKVDRAGTITTVAGALDAASLGDGGPAIHASLSDVTSITIDRLGNLYLADADDERIRKVDTRGIITTVAGNGSFGFSGDKGAAVAATLAHPAGVAVDATGNLYIADRANNRIRRVDPSGIITTIAGGPLEGVTGDGGPAVKANISQPSCVAVDAAGNLYLGDQNRLRRIDRRGIITTVAGNGTASFSRDGVPATSATLSRPAAIAIDGAGNLYLTADARVREVVGLT